MSNLSRSPTSLLISAKPVSDFTFEELNSLYRCLSASQQTLLRLDNYLPEKILKCEYRKLADEINHVQFVFDRSFSVDQMEISNVVI